MKRNESYNTKQKDEILKVMKKYSHEFTVRDIYNDLGESVGLTTIYRFVQKLVLKGVIARNIGSDNVTYYQYLEKCDHENHFYLKCDNCGEMIHIDCDCISELTSHIIDEHGFKLNKEKIILSGLCKKCLNSCGGK